MEIVFATRNPNKIKEVQSLLPKTIKLLSLEDIGCTEILPETCPTLKENAKQKADFVSQQYAYSCFADDTGLIVPSLGGAPGVHSARYAGTENNASKNMKKLLQNMTDVEDRSAYFETVVALNMEGETHYFEGQVHGRITKGPKGQGGFGYDPIFVPKGKRTTFAELPLSEKNKISHRAIAVERLVQFLTQYMALPTSVK